MKQLEIQQTLINGTISVIANDGLDKATTKHISQNTGINEAYIYRCFKDKEDLFAKTFSSLDRELIAVILKRLPIMYMSDLSMEARCRMFFSFVWKFLLANKEKCLCFVRYYYSPYFKKYSFEEHKNNYKTIVEKFRTAFRPEANVWMLLNHILNVLLDFAVKVYDGEIPDNDDTAEHVFRVIFVSVKQYFNKSEEN